MKTNSLCSSLLAFALTLLIAIAASAQTPPKVYSEVYYHKLKPGHTLTEALAIENEFKKIHQAQANDGFLLGWYILALDMTTNPSKEYEYITIKNFSDLTYLDNAYPQKYFSSVMGTDYQTKRADLYKRMREVKEVAKIEVWEQIEGAQAKPLLAPYKAPIWVVTDIKVKNGQYTEYVNHVKKAKPFYGERVVTGGAVGWNFAGLLTPWATEKTYDFAMVNQYPSMKVYMESGPKAEAAFKKTMPGVDYTQFYKELNNLREPARQELYYLHDYALKAPAAAVQLDTKQLDSYVGVYEGPFGDNPKATFTVTREGNQLFEQLTGGRNLEIIPRSETRFYFAQMDAELEFIRDASGKVTKRTLTFGGQTSEAKKIN
jgi:hypothetical protein